MIKFRSFCLVAATAVAAFVAGAAQAQTAPRTFVSGVGDDSNACSRTAPCKSFGGALAKTEEFGEVDCLDPGGFGFVTITKSVTIDCHEQVGSILNDGTAAILVAFDSFEPNDRVKTVNLRNLTLQGTDNGSIGIHLTGVGAGTAVNIEDCLITNNLESPAGGIVDDRSRGMLTINNTTVRSSFANGILISTSNGSVRAMISNTRVINSNIGITAGPDANVVISHSIVSGNSVAGLVVQSGGTMIVDSTVIAHNGNGIQNAGTVELSNSDVTYNTTAVSGSVNSFSNNRFTKNTTLGTIIPIGTTSNPSGLQ